MNTIFNIGWTTFRIRTDAGIRRHSLVANAALPANVGILTGVESRPESYGRRKENANPNSMGPVVFGKGLRCYFILYTWVYSINSSSTPALATHAFGERRINGKWQLVLVPNLGVQAQSQVTVYYPF